MKVSSEVLSNKEAAGPNEKETFGEAVPADKLNQRCWEILEDKLRQQFEKRWKRMFYHKPEWI
jgi:hypothetical protein